MFLPLVSCAAFGQYEESKGDVPWVPTPDEVMHTVFRMAKVKAHDVVYDLGSGDGRVLVYAAKKLGSHGVGVERIFPLNSPKIVRIDVNKRGIVRRARLFYLRKY